MKRLIAYFIIISLLLGYVGNANVVSAKAKIQSTVREKKLTIDSVKNLATNLEHYNYPSEYAQVVDGHYYYMRQTGENNRYTVYQDKGEKVGSFKYEESQGWEYWWYAFGWHEGKLYVEFTNEDDHKIKIGEVDFKQESIKTICTCKLPVAFNMNYVDVYVYQNKVYAMYNKRKVKEFDMSSGNLLNTFSLPKQGKNEYIYFINIADGRIYYASEEWKGKITTITYRCLNMVTNKDKKVIRCNVPAKDSYFESIIIKGKDIYCHEQWGAYDNYYRRVFMCSISSVGAKMQQIGKGKIRDFAYNNKYFFYIDKKYRLHRQNRKTGKDKIISGIKAVKVDCTKQGLYVQKYDKWFVKEGFEDGFSDYAYALYFMNFKGGNVKKIAKYTIGHYSYYGWWD